MTINDMAVSESGAESANEAYQIVCAFMESKLKEEAHAS
jgi:hypothetical protein